MHTVGIDVSSQWFHAALDETTVSRFANTREGILTFADTLLKRGCTPDTTLLGLESTGVYHLLLCATLQPLRWRLKVINPLVSHRLTATSLRRLKTDRHDALIIRKALLVSLGDFYADTPETLAIKTLVGERQTLVRIQAGLKQRIRNHQLREAAAGLLLGNSFARILAALAREIKTMERRIQPYARQQQKLLQSIPGIGPVTSAALVAHIGDITRFSSPEKLVAYIGLDPRVYESGTSIRGKGYLTKRGNAYLRHILFNAAFIARRVNPELKRYFEKKIAEGKHYFSASCAVERKLVHLIWAVWRRGTPFERR